MKTIIAAACAAVSTLAVAAAPAVAQISPGVQTVTEGSGQCTANFIFASGDRRFIGQSAHCASIDAATATDGCIAKSLPLGTKVTVGGATRQGTLAYSSWITMQQRGETDANACAYNDFALVELDPADLGRINPSVPFWGGPTGMNTTGVPTGAKVLSYGNSSLRLGLTALSPKEGTSVGTNGGGWNHPVYTVTPGIPGDSGSAFLDGQGRALGTLSTLALAPLPASNGVSDLSRELAYLNANGPFDASLVLGSAFRGPLLP